MWVFLLLLGALTAVAGLTLVVPGAAIHGGTLDSEAITPGTIAAVGGLVLIAMGLAVRALQRIERALSVRPSLVAVGAGDTTVQSLPDAPRLPFPPKRQATSLGGHYAAPGQAEGEVADRMPATSVAAAVAFGGNRKGAAAAGAKPDLGFTAARLSTSPDRVRGPTFASPRLAALRARSEATAVRAAARVSAQVMAPPLAAAPEAPVDETYAAASPSGESAPKVAVSVLKSGVVEGMAYTLYSDGAIEARLPQGTLRFRSITALRHHIEGVS